MAKVFSTWNRATTELAQVAPEIYSHMVNFSNSYRELHNLGKTTNVKGTISISSVDAPNFFTPHVLVELSNELYIIGVTNQLHTVQIAIYKLTFNSTYTTVTYNNVASIEQEDWSTTYYFSVIGLLETEEVSKIYLNYVRTEGDEFFDATGYTVFIRDSETVIMKDTCVHKLLPTPSTSVVNGGSLGIGSYKYSYRLIHKNGYTTQWSNTSTQMDLPYVTPNGNRGVAPINSIAEYQKIIPSGKSVDVTVTMYATYLTEGFTHMELLRIHSYNADMEPTYEIVKVLPLSATTLQLNDGTNYNVLAVLEPLEVKLPKITYKYAAQAAFKDYRFIMNIKETIAGEEIDMRAYQFPAFQTTKNISQQYGKVGEMLPGNYTMSSADYTKATSAGTGQIDIPLRKDSNNTTDSFLAGAVIPGVPPEPDKPVYGASGLRVTVLFAYSIVNAQVVPSKHKAVDWDGFPYADTSTKLLETSNNTTFRGVQHDSVYSLAVILERVDGSKTDVQFIGNINTPSMTLDIYNDMSKVTTSGGNSWKKLDMQVHIALEPAMASKYKSFQVVYKQRTIRDLNVFGIGLAFPARDGHFFRSGYSLFQNKGVYAVYTLESISGIIPWYKYSTRLHPLGVSQSNPDVGFDIPGFCYRHRNYDDFGTQYIPTIPTMNKVVHTEPSLDGVSKAKVIAVGVTDVYNTPTKNNVYETYQPAETTSLKVEITTCDIVIPDAVYDTVSTPRDGANKPSLVQIFNNQYTRSNEAFTSLELSQFTPFSPWTTLTTRQDGYSDGRVTVYGDVFTGFAEIQLTQLIYSGETASFIDTDITNSDIVASTAAVVRYGSFFTESFINMNRPAVLSHEVSTPKLYRLASGFKKVSGVFSKYFKAASGGDVAFSSTRKTTHEEDVPAAYNIASCYNKLLVDAKYFIKSSIVDMSTSFPTRVHYSNKKLSGEFYDNYLQFAVNNFADLPTMYGQGTELVVFQENLLAFQERAIHKLWINETTQTVTTSGAALAVGKGDLLGNEGGRAYQLIAEGVGCALGTKIVRSRSSLYWYDKFNRHIYRYTGQGAPVAISLLNDISDLFVNTLLESTKFIGVYDSATSDVYLTLLNTDNAGTLILDYYFIVNDIIDMQFSLYGDTSNLRLHVGQNIVLSADYPGILCVVNEILSYRIKLEILNLQEFPFPDGTEISMLIHKDKIASFTLVYNELESQFKYMTSMHTGFYIPFRKELFSLPYPRTGLFGYSDGSNLWKHVPTVRSSFYGKLHASYVTFVIPINPKASRSDLISWVTEFNKKLPTQLGDYASSANKTLSAIYLEDIQYKSDVVPLRTMKADMLFTVDPITRAVTLAATQPTGSKPIISTVEAMIDYPAGYNVDKRNNIWSAGLPFLKMYNTATSPLQESTIPNKVVYQPSTHKYVTVTLYYFPINSVDTVNIIEIL